MSVDVLLQLGYFLLGGWWQDLHSATEKPFIPQNTKTQRNLKIHSVGVPPVQLPFAEQLTG